MSDKVIYSDLDRWIYDKVCETPYLYLTLGRLIVLTGYRTISISNIIKILNSIESLTNGEEPLCEFDISRSGGIIIKRKGVKSLLGVRSLEQTQ